MVVATKVVDPFLDVAILCRGVLSLFCFGPEVFDRVSQVEVSSRTIDGFVHNLRLSWLLSLSGSTTHSLDFQAVADTPDTAVDDLPARPWSGGGFATGLETALAWRRPVNRVHRVSALSHPALDEQNDDCSRGAPATAELVIQNDRAGIEVGPLADVQKLSQVVELETIQYSAHAKVWRHSHLGMTRT